MNNMEIVTEYEDRNSMVMAIYRENPAPWDNTGAYISIVGM